MYAYRINPYKWIGYGEMTTDFWYSNTITKICTTFQFQDFFFETKRSYDFWIIHLFILQRTYENCFLVRSYIWGHSLTMMTRIRLFWPPTFLHWHFLPYKSCQKFNIFGLLSPPPLVYVVKECLLCFIAIYFDDYK